MYIIDKEFYKVTTRIVIRKHRTVRLFHKIARILIIIKTKKLMMCNKFHSKFIWDEAAWNKKRIRGNDCTFLRSCNDKKRTRQHNWLFSLTFSKAYYALLRRTNVILVLFHPFIGFCRVKIFSIVSQLYYYKALIK